MRRHTVHAKGAKPTDLYHVREEAWCVIFRTGGTENFKWHRSLPMTDGQVEHVLGDVLLGGRAAYAERFNLSLAMGLPTTFNPFTPIRVEDL